MKTLAEGRILVVSSAHVTKRDDELLKVHAAMPSLGGPIVYASEHWLLVYLNQEEELEKFSRDFRRLYSWALALTLFTYIKLDSDGPLLERFPTHEW